MAGEFDFAPLSDEELADIANVQDEWGYITLEGVQAMARELRASRAALRKVEPLLGEVRVLDCGAHYCRYCSAKSPGWEHAPYCLYVESQKAAEAARALRQEIRALVAHVGGGGE